jgi:hypothetical protein
VFFRVVKCLLVRYARDKRSSLFARSVSNKEKVFYNIETKEYVIKLFSSQLMNGPFKLECLSE